MEFHIQKPTYNNENANLYNDLTNDKNWVNSLDLTSIKDDLIKKGLIEIENSNKIKYIKLTEKGLNVFNKLSEINKLVKK